MITDDRLREVVALEGRSMDLSDLQWLTECAEVAIIAPDMAAELLALRKVVEAAEDLPGWDQSCDCPHCVRFAAALTEWRALSGADTGKEHG